MFHSAWETNTEVAFQDQNEYAQGKKQKTNGPIEGIPFYHYLS